MMHSLKESVDEMKQRAKALAATFDFDLEQDGGGGNEGVKSFLKGMLSEDVIAEVALKLQAAPCSVKHFEAEFVAHHFSVRRCLAMTPWLML